MLDVIKNYIQNFSLQTVTNSAIFLLSGTIRANLSLVNLNRNQENAQRSNKKDFSKGQFKKVQSEGQCNFGTRFSLQADMPP